MKSLKNIAPFQAIDMLNFVAHKKNQISSKAIIDRKELEIRFFSASNGEIIDKECYESETIFFCVSGKIKIIYNSDDERILNPGEFMALDSDVHYGVIALEDSVFYNILINL